MKYRLAWLFLCLCTFSTLSEELASFKSDFRPNFNKQMSVSQLRKLNIGKEAVLLDVRLREDFQRSPILIPGAEYRDPEAINDWVSELDKTQEIIVYCIAGKWVSHKAAYILEQNGLSVSILEGGLNAWQK